MGKFKRKSTEVTVELVGVALCANNKNAKGKHRSEHQCLDCEGTVAITANIIKAMEEIVNLGNTLGAAKAAKKNAKERINQLKEQTKLMENEVQKADDAVKETTQKIMNLQAFLREKGIKI